ncbi:MAG: hypothetical protein ACR2F4_07230 [Thermoleophilaceae bacterium]
MEFWAYAVRDPQLRHKFAIPFSAVRLALARSVNRHAQQTGLELSLPAEQVATIISLQAGPQQQHPGRPNRRQAVQHHRA